MADVKTYKFSGATSKKPEDIIAQVKDELITAKNEKSKEEEKIIEETITIANYTEFLRRVMPKVIKAKKHEGLVPEFVQSRKEQGLGPIVKYVTCNIATIAQEEGVDKSEIQKIWDMV